jgi:hypothetical protein
VDFFLESWIINGWNTSKSKNIYFFLKESILEKLIEFEEFFLLDEIIKKYLEKHL